MKKNYFVPCLALLVILISCSRKDPHVRPEHTITIHPASTIDTTLDAIADTFYFKKLVLPDTSIHFKARKFTFLKKWIIAYDRVKSAIFVFNGDGSLKNIINHKGIGKGLYFSIDDIAVDEQQELIEVWDSHLRKIFVYDLSGKFVNSMDVDEGAGLHFSKNVDNYVFNRDNLDFDGMRLATFQKKNGELKFARSFLAIPKPLKNFAMLSDHAIESYRDSLYYIPLFDGHIYKITAEDPIPVCDIISPDYPVLTSRFTAHDKFRDVDEYFNTINHEKMLYDFSNLFINDDYITFRYSVRINYTRPPFHNIIYIKKKNKILDITGIRLKNFSKFLSNNYVVGKEGRFFIVSIMPYSYHVIPAKFRTGLPPEILEGIDNPNASPVLLYYRLKL